MAGNYQVKIRIHPSISRIHSRLRQVNEEAYTPKVVSIGPLHHDEEKLKAMEEHKKRYFTKLTLITNANEEFYRQVVWEKEEELRSCYADTIHFSKDEFVNIILVDAAFIIIFLLKCKYENLRDGKDHILRDSWMLEEVLHDMLLLENQIPFFIIKDLYNHGMIIESDQQEKIGIFELSLEFFERLQILEVKKGDWEEGNSNVEHFVDFLKQLCVPLKRQNTGRVRQRITHSITELQQAGVTFEVGESRKLFDFQFKNGIVEIPKLTVRKETEIYINNVIAFELCYQGCSSMNHYVALMNCLIKTPRDEDLVVKKGIVENFLSNDERVSSLINRLCVGVKVNYEKFYFAGLCEDLDSYYKAPNWHKWKAALKRNYSHKLLAILTLVGGGITITVPMIQMISSVISTWSSDGN